jgi:peptidyl-prolyl cis-trans isomerase SurA
MGHKQNLRKMMVGIILASLLICPCVGAVTLNRVVAVVNDDVITLYELNRKMKEMTGTSPEQMRLQDEQKFLEMRKKVLELLIDQKIAQKKVQELGIEISEQEIDDSIERVKRNNRWTQEDLIARLKTEGISYEQYREDMRKDLERYRLINYAVNSKIVIRQEELKKYYEEHKDDYTTEGKVRIATIIIMAKSPGDETARRSGEEILARIKKGEDFGALAKEFSQGPAAQQGGDLGTFKISELDPELRKICQEIPEGGVSDLIVRPGGVQILKLLEKDTGKTKSFEQVKDAIYNILYKQEVDQLYKSWIKELRESSYTRITF